MALTVVGGYLGAGKTTLINRLLAEGDGRRILVMVNDFGAINIDAALLASAEGDTLTLTNGCVCCTMGADLYMALGRVLERLPLPDHIVIEASGVADPARVAIAARAEPRLAYGGVVTVVDGPAFDGLTTDDLIGVQLRGQIAASDLAVVTKCEGAPAERVAAACRDLGAGHARVLTPATSVLPLLLSPVLRLPSARGAGDRGHADHVSFTAEGDLALTRQHIEAHLAGRPPGMFRFKGLVRGSEGEGFEVHVVGRSIDIKPAPQPDRTRVVGIGPQGRVTARQMADWWAGAAQSPL